MSDRKFSTSEVCNLADVTNASLQDWFAKGLITGHPDQIEGAGASGRHRKFSIHGVMQIAIAARLIEIGVKNRNVAFGAAMSFAHVSKASGPRREPGLPFHYRHGSTFVCVAGDRYTIHAASPASIPYAVIRSKLSGAPGFTLLDATEVFYSVAGKLGQSPKAVLDQAYPEDAEKA